MVSGQKGRRQGAEDGGQRAGEKEVICYSLMVNGEKTEVREGKRQVSRKDAKAQREKGKRVNGYSLMVNGEKTEVREGKRQVSRKAAKAQREKNQNTEKSIEGRDRGQRRGQNQPKSKKNQHLAVRR